MSRLRHPATYAMAAIVLAAAVRVAGYAARWPLFIDDARLATNIAIRSPFGLTHPLAFEQTAPLPLLWGDWALVHTFGVNELALRALPLLCGIAMLVLLWRLGASIFGPREGLLAVLFAAGSPLLIYFAAYSVKQYGVDACVTSALLLLAVPVVRDPAGTRGWGPLALGGIIGMWASQPAVFVLTGIGLAIAAAWPRDDRARVARHAAGTAVAWLLSFAALYFGWYRPVAHNPYMARYWANSFLGIHRPDLGAALYHAGVNALVLPFTANLFVSVRAIAILVVIGLIVIGYRQGVRWACLVGGPYLALAAALLLGNYPAGARLMLFAVPCLFLACAAAIVGLIDLAPRVTRTALVAVVGLGLAYHALIGAGAEAQQISPIEDSRPVIAALDGVAPVYVMARGIPAWVFYTTDWRRPDTAWFHWLVNETAAPNGPAFENGVSLGHVIETTDSLIYRTDGRPVLLGLRSGIEFPRRDAKPYTADTGWAEHEALRMRAVANPRVWLFASHFTFHYRGLEDSELGMLLAAAARDGGVIEQQLVRSDAAAFRIAFPTTPSASSSGGSP